MSAPGSNPHKKGEHVFNDIAGAASSAVEQALRWNRANSLVLTGPHGPLRLVDFPSTSSALSRLRRDVVLKEARTVVAPAAGVSSDANSELYGQAKRQFEEILSDLVASMAVLVWRKKPRANSSFHAFESIVSGVRNSRLLVAASKSAFGALIDASHDRQAEVAALAERVSDSELARRRSAINRMHQYDFTLRQFGSTLIDTLSNELEFILERRIGAA